MELMSRLCPLCGSSDTSNIFADANYTIGRLDNFAFASRKTPEFMHYRLIDCPVCDLLYATPLPCEEYLIKGYGEAAYDSSVEAHYAAATYADILSTFVERLPDRHGALDIGTGDGAFLECLLELGFDQVEGVEPSRAPIAVARNDIKPLIREGSFNADDFAPNSFNLVTCFQTLEHLYNPLVMTKSVYHLLKPGGAAFFICHNRRALSAKILGRKSPIFDIEHLQLFSPSSARYLLEKSGFKDIIMLQIINRYPISYWIKLLPLPTDFKLALTNAINKSGAGKLAISIPVGNIAVVGFRQKP